MTIRDQINDVINHFDFDKVHSVMEFLDWNWWNYASIPTKFELQKKAYELLSAAYDLHRLENERAVISTAGFEALCDNDADGIWFELKFVLTDWTTAY